MTPGQIAAQCALVTAAWLTTWWLLIEAIDYGLMVTEAAMGGQ